MAVYKADILDIELNTGNIARSFLCHNIGKDDQKADRFGVRCFRDGEPVSLSGVSIQGFMLRPNGSHFHIHGSANTGVSGNEAWVDLPQEAYDYEGQFCLALKLIGGEVTGTIRIIDGMVNNTFVDGAVAPTAAVPTYQEILSVYDQMVAAKNGSVRFDTDQTLTAAQMTQARGNIEAASESDVSDLKSALEALPSTLVVNSDMINENTTGDELVDFTDYTATNNAYIDENGTIQTDQTGLCITTGLIDISDLPDTLYVRFGATVEAYTGRRCMVIKNTDNSYSAWVYSALPSSFATKESSRVVINLKYLKDQGTRSQVAFNLTKADHYIKYGQTVSYPNKALKWLDVEYGQMSAEEPINLYGKTCSAFGGSTVSGETATVTAVNQGIMTNPFESNSNVVRVTAKITFTTPNVHVLLPYYANGSWQYGNLLDLPGIVSGTEFTFTFDAANYVVYQSAERFRLIFQTRSEDGVSDYSGTITITKLEINSLSSAEQSEYYDKDFVPMMEKVFAGIEDAKTKPEPSGGGGSNIIVAPDGKKYIVGIDGNGQIIAIPIIPNKTLFCGNSLLLGMNTSSANHQYVYGMCASAPDKDYCYKMMSAIQAINPSATYDRVHGAAFEQLGTSDSFSTLWNTTNNVYTGEPMKNSFTNDLDLIVIQLSDNINTDDKETAFASNIDDFITEVRTASPKARLVWVYGWFQRSSVNNIITTTCAKWGIPTVNIHSLNTKANQGYSGQTYVTGNGGTATVSDNWITHPGDTGFTAIANAILNGLGID